MPRIVLSYGGGGGDPPDILQAFQQQWQDNLGIEIELQAVETAAYLRELDRGDLPDGLGGLDRRLP